MRLFVALPLPEALKDALAKTQGALAAQLPETSVRWTQAEQQHLTLLFLGETPEEKLPALGQILAFACRRRPPFSLQTGALGAFPSLRRASVLWLGVSGEVEALRRLHAALAEQLMGFYRPDERGFSPHLTLGRVKGLGHARAVAEALETVPSEPPVGWKVDEVRLYSSRLAAGGPRYTVLERVPLEA